MKHSIIDAQMLAALLKGGYQELLSQKEIINNLNVFPIPDGDTGLNMGRTLQGGIETLKDDSSFKDMMKAFSKGALMSARGNSGVILSQFFRGFAKGVADIDAMSVYDFAKAMKAGRDQAYSAVVNPVEGTMLTLMTDGSNCLDKDSIVDFESLFEVLIPELKASLQRTPSLLDVLAEAGVVDSGGAGFLAIFNGMAKALSGEITAEEVHEEAAPKAAEPVAMLLDENSEIEFGYCTEFILQLFSKKTDVENFDIDAFIEELKKLGDSIVAIRDEELVKVHIHTKTPEVPLAFAHQYGEFVTMKIENMTVQHNEVINEHSDSAAAKATSPKASQHQKFAVVTTASGEGFISYFKDHGVDVVIDGGQTNNPSTEDFINAFSSLDADHIVVLPNNTNIIMAAEQAAELYKVCDVRIIPTKSLAEGYSSISLMDPFAANIDDFIRSMTYALGNVTTAMVSTATRDAEMDGVTIRKGQYVGIIDKEIRISGDDKLSTTINLLTGDEEISDKDVITVFYGKDVTEDEANALENLISENFPLLEVAIVPGLQDVYSFIIAIE